LKRGDASRSAQMLLTGGRMAVRTMGPVRRPGHALKIRRERQVPQPLLPSLSLRTSWLLPGDIGIVTEYLKVKVQGEQ